MARKPTMKKVLMTINNPTEHGIDWKEFKFRLNLLPPFDYLVISEEQGVQEQTPHYHAYIHFHTGVSFERLKQLFPSCHIDFPKGTDLENKLYVEKQGKWADTEKGNSEHHLRDEEYGTIKENYTSEERYKFKPDTAEVFANIYTMASSGMTPIDIIEEMPCAIKYLYQVEKLCKLFENAEKKRKAEALNKALKEKEENLNFDNDTLSRAFDDFLIGDLNDKI